MSHPVDVLLATVVDGATSTPEVVVVAVDEARSTKLWRLLNKMGEQGLCSGLLLVLLTLELELSLDGEGAVGPNALKVGGSNGILPAKKIFIQLFQTPLTLRSSNFQNVKLTLVFVEI